ncbi:type 4a pilus biogenesis protein PilO [Candidatus Peregrinibacteria bacterium]|jgi:Tfp pilus assembly protein PilO|nr:type 4a pilus biogenesis protein PilO [Candidatus Peregrinibacteria bacterium]
MKNKSNIKNVVSLLLALAILVIYMYYIQPSSEKLEEKRLEKAQMEEQLTDLQNSVDELLALQASIPKSVGERQLLLAQVPTDLDQDGLIKDLNRLASNRGIELKNIGFALQGVDQETGVGVVTMATGFEGTYQDLINLLADVENNVRKLRVKNISVQVLEVSREVSAEVSFTLTIEAYYQG